MNLGLREVIQRKTRNKPLLHINFSILEQLKGIFDAVKQANVYLIVALSEGERKYFGTKLAKIVNDYFNSLLKRKKVFLSADHCHSLNSIRQAAEAGYDLIVVDFSIFPLKKNIHQTRKGVKLAKSINPNILVEGELGYLPGKSKVLSVPPKISYTKVEQAEIFVKKTGIDLLAPAVGNFHGKVLNFSPKIDVNLIKEIKEKVKIPLVLHGGSGIKKSVIKKAAKAGISIVHFNTDIREAWRRSLEKSLNRNKEEVAPYKILPKVIQDIKGVIEGKICES